MAIGLDPFEYIPLLIHKRYMISLLNLEAVTLLYEGGRERHCRLLCVRRMTDGEIPDSLSF